MAAVPPAAWRCSGDASGDIAARRNMRRLNEELEAQLHLEAQLGELERSGSRTAAKGSAGGPARRQRQRPRRAELPREAASTAASTEEARRPETREQVIAFTEALLGEIDLFEKDVAERERTPQRRHVGAYDEYDSAVTDGEAAEHRKYDEASPERRPTKIVAPTILGTRSVEEDVREHHGVFNDGYGESRFLEDGTFERPPPLKTLREAHKPYRLNDSVPYHPGRLRHGEASNDTAARWHGSDNGQRPRAVGEPQQAAPEELYNDASRIVTKVRHGFALAADNLAHEASAVTDACGGGEVPSPEATKRQDLTDEAFGRVAREREAATVQKQQELELLRHEASPAGLGNSVRLRYLEALEAEGQRRELAARLRWPLAAQRRDAEGDKERLARAKLWLLRSIETAAAMRQQPRGQQARWQQRRSQQREQRRDAFRKCYGEEAGIEENAVSPRAAAPRAPAATAGAAPPAAPPGPGELRERVEELLRLEAQEEYCAARLHLEAELAAGGGRACSACDSQVAHLCEVLCTLKALLTALLAS